MGNSCWTCPPSPVQMPVASPQRRAGPLLSYSGQSASSLHSHVKTLTQSRSKKRAIERDQGPSREAANAIPSDRPKTAGDRKLILAALNRHIIFRALDEEAKETAVSAMKLLAFPARELVIEQGFRAKYYFVMVVGKAEKLVDGKRTGVISPGDSFGEIALMHDQPRNATVRALADCEFWALERMSFRHFVEITNSKAQADNEAFIRSISMFSQLSEFQMEALISSLTACSFSKGEEIIAEGTRGDWVYFIKEGEVVCRKETRTLRRMGPREFFGELAYLSGGRRTASVIALTDVKCAYISVQHFISALGDCVQNVLYTNSIQIALEQHRIAARLLPTQLARLTQALRVECFDHAAVVVYKDTPLSDGLWIVLRGKLTCEKEKFAGARDCFGLQSSGVASDDIAVGSETADIAWLTRAEVEAIIGCTWAEAPANFEAFALFRRVPLFRCLPEEQLLSLAMAAQLREFADKERISSCDCFYVLRAGEVTSPGNSWEDVTCFGEESLFADIYKDSPVTARGAVSCWELSRSDFAKVIATPMRELMRRRLHLYDGSVELQDLVPVKLLGRGMFGVVFLVHSPSRRCHYALKSVSRAKIAKYGLHRNIVLERDIMMQLDHSLVAKLVKTFKDSKRVYYLTEYVSGTDFFEVLRILGLVQESEAKFYTASLLLVLELLHSRSIAYRDLKPENIMIDEEGYIKLIDFGTAKVVSGRTYSVVGTPHYMAPEVILGKGYGLMVDLWSLGVILYEMVFGTVPFGEDEEDPYAVYEHTLDHQLRFPQESSALVRQVIEQLLSADPTCRSSGGALHLKTHKWLKGFDWEALTSRLLPPPFRPVLAATGGETGREKDVQATVECEEGEDIQALSGESAPPPEWDEEF